jgi:DNA-binding CsgD family transcriptional regulator
MPTNPVIRVITNAYDAAVAPDLWPLALETVTSHLGAAGAAYIVFNKHNSQVDWACFSGPSVEMKEDYVRHYATLDPYSPVLMGAQRGKWLALSDCLPQAVLRSDEWYNDFVLKSGICDILGVRLLDGPSHAVILGLHQETGQGPFTPASVEALEEVFEPLSKAAGLHVELRSRGLKSGLAQFAFGTLAAGVIVTDADGQIVELNPAAERILQRNDGLLVRKGKLALLRVPENAKLEQLLAIAAESTKSKTSIGHILVGRRGHRQAYPLTVASLRPELSHREQPLAMVVVTDPAGPVPASRQLTELFGLSAAECRLAVALTKGQTLRNITIESGLQITTLRTQLTSILKKVGVRRQAELVRVLSRIPTIGE